MTLPASRKPERRGWQLFGGQQASAAIMTGEIDVPDFPTYSDVSEPTQKPGKTETNDYLLWICGHIPFLSMPTEMIWKLLQEWKRFEGGNAVQSSKGFKIEEMGLHSRFESNASA